MENFNIHSTAQIGKGCEILAESVNIGPNVVIRENFKFNGQSLTTGFGRASASQGTPSMRLARIKRSIPSPGTLDISMGPTARSHGSI